MILTSSTVEKPSPQETMPWLKNLLTVSMRKKAKKRLLKRLLRIKSQFKMTTAVIVMKSWNNQTNRPQFPSKRKLSPQ
jgi:hypothetical protein